MYSKLFLITMLMSGVSTLAADKVPLASTSMVGDGIALFIPQGNDPEQTLVGNGHQKTSSSTELPRA